MCEEQSVDDLNVDFRIQVEPRYNELLYHEDLGKRTIFFAPNNSKIKGREAQFKKNIDIAKIHCQSLGPLLYQGSIV